MDRLWAPWRMTYIERESESAGTTPAPKVGCIFCDKPKNPVMADELIIAKGEHAFVLMNIYPYNNGHLMVAPYQHTAHYDELAPDVSSEITALTQRAIKALTRAFAPHGFNIGMNLGVAAGAGIAQHLHQHIVPRWTGDSNFMPVIGEIKVLPDSLERSYEKIVAAWND